MSKRKQSTYGKIGESKKRKLDLTLIKIQYYRELMRIDKITRTELNDCIAKNEIIIDYDEFITTIKCLLNLIYRTGKFADLKRIIIPTTIYLAVDEMPEFLGLITKLGWLPRPLMCLLIESAKFSEVIGYDDDVIEMQDETSYFEIIKFSMDKKYYVTVEYCKNYFYNVALLIAISDLNVKEWNYTHLVKDIMKIDRFSPEIMNWRGKIMRT